VNESSKSNQVNVSHGGIASAKKGKMTHGNITDDLGYQAFVLEMTLRCHCTPESDRPCDGLLAGGLCDDLHLGPREACDGFDEDEPDNL
jgi:hypothetical protein